MHILAKCSGLKVGELVHVIADAHIYDRHIPVIEEIIAGETHDAPTFTLEDIDDFYKFTPSSVKLENYIYNEFKHKIPVAI